jgi:hypothetical protein
MNALLMHETESMMNPHAHVPFCQTSLAIAESCPACRWALLEWSQPSPGPDFEKKLAQEDERFLAELLISF